MGVDDSTRAALLGGVKTAVEQLSAYIYCLHGEIVSLFSPSAEVVLKRTIIKRWALS